MQTQKLYIIFCAMLCTGVTFATPKISIITSVYDGDCFIEGFLQDITQQTIFDQCELILINANSPGNEEPIIKKYMNMHPNIIYAKLDSDPGLYATWNMAIKVAQGIYITNANLDDRLAHDCYEVHAAHLDEYTDVDLVYSDKYITKQPNETFDKHTGSKWAPSPQATRENMNECWPCANPMWRKSLHDRFGLFDEEYRCSGDWEMWLRALQGGAQLKKVPGYYLLYYHNPKGLSTGWCYRSDNKRDQKKIAEDKKIIERYGYMWGAPSYRTYYTMARALEHSESGNPQIWQRALVYYLKAYSINPQRAEPLIRIAQYYLEKGEPSLAYLFASQAMNIPCPAIEAGLVEHELYDYARYDIMGQAAWYVKAYDEGEQAVRMALEVHPEYEHLQRNIIFYLGREKS